MGENFSYKKNILNRVDEEISSGRDMDKISKILYPEPPEDDELIELFDLLVSREERSTFWLVTRWIKRRVLYRKEYMEFYRSWLYEHVEGWGACDIFCYRVLNPMIDNLNFMRAC